MARINDQRATQRLANFNSICGQRDVAARPDHRRKRIGARVGAFAVGAALALTALASTAPNASASQPAGRISWTKQFGSNVDDRFYSVATNASGQVYATGTTKGSMRGTNLGNTDGVLVRYDLNGRRKWVRQFGTPDWDYAMAVATTRTGDTYVVGYTLGGFGAANAGTGTEDVFLVKYDRNGNRKWVRQFGSADDDEGIAVAVSSSGDIYIAGTTLGDITPLDAVSPVGGKDFFVAKYDRNGNRKWIHQSGSFGQDNVGGIAVSTNSGRLYVAGDTSGSMPTQSSSGSWDGYLAWVDIVSGSPSEGTDVLYRQFGSTGSEQIHGVAADASGNAYLVGETDDALVGSSAGGNDAIMVKYSPAGNNEWTRQFGTSSYDLIQSVAISSSGRVYVTGSTGGDLAAPNAGLGDVFTARFDGNGVQQWAQQFGSASIDWSYGVSAAPSGDLIIAANTNGELGAANLGTDFDLVLAKYRASSTGSWGRQVGTVEWDTVDRVTRTSSNRLVAVGTTEAELVAGQSKGQRDYFITRFDTKGAVDLELQGGTSALDEVGGIASDSDGSIYVLGSTAGSFVSAGGDDNHGLGDLFVVKYDSTGVVQWRRMYGTTSNEYAYGIAATPSGSVYVAASTLGNLEGTSAGNRDAVVMRIDRATGNVLWQRQFGSSGDDEIYSIAVSPNGDVFVAGSTGDSLPGATDATGPGDEDAFVAKFDRNGTRKWVRQFGSTADDVAMAIAVTPSGEAYVGGNTQGTIPGATASGASIDGFLARFDRNGRRKWVRQFGTGTGRTTADAVVATSGGTATVVGLTNGVFATPSLGNTDAMLIQFDRNGRSLRRAQWGSNGADALTGAALASNGALVAVGYTYAAFAGPQIGNGDGIIARIAF